MPTTTARLVAATCLVVTALLSTVSVMLQPEFSADPSDRLAAIDASGAAGAISLLTFVLAQLPFLVAVVALALLARTVSPRLAAAGGALAVIGGFGHAVFGGVGLAYLAMSSDVADRAAMAEVVTRIESGPAVLFMASGLLGTVIGLVLLGIALLRSGAVARWIPWTLWAFLVTEFAISNVTEWAAPAAGLLYLAAFGGVAAQLVRGDLAADREPRALVGTGSGAS
ncbi:MAG: hypothetical protein ABWX73_08210 [Marmoricola sp.]